MGLEARLDPGGHQTLFLFHLSGLFDSVWLCSQAARWLLAYQVFTAMYLMLCGIAGRAGRERWGEEERKRFSSF